jgi:exoribonuclease II
MNWLDLFHRLRLLYPNMQLTVAPEEQPEDDDMGDRWQEFMETTNWDVLAEVSCETVHPIINRVIEKLDPDAERLDELFPDMPLLQQQVASCVATEMANQLKEGANGHQTQHQRDAILSQVGFSVMLAFQVERIWNGETHGLP